MAKLRWVPEPVGLALNLFHMPPSAVFAAVVACAVIAGPLLFTRDLEPRRRAAVLGLALVMIPLSYAPNLLTQENYATYRTVGPMSAAFALLAGLVLVAFDREPFSRAIRLSARGALVALAAVSVALGFNHLRTLIALPQSREWRLVKREVATLPPRATTVGLVAPTIDGGPITTKYGVRDEFGLPTSYSTWADASLVWLALRDPGRTPSHGFQVRVVTGSRRGLPAGLPYVNMLGVKYAR